MYDWTGFIVHDDVYLNICVCVRVCVCMSSPNNNGWASRFTQLLYNPYHLEGTACTAQRQYNQLLSSNQIGLKIHPQSWRQQLPQNSWFVDADSSGRMVIS